MSKRILSVMLSMILVSSIFAGCGDKDETTDNAASSDAASQATDENFVIVNDNVKVAEYKGLSIEGFDENVSESDINSFIDYVMQYVYVPEEETVDVADVSEKTDDEAEKEEKEDESNEEKSSDDAVSKETADTEEATDTEKATDTEEPTEEKPQLTYKDLTDEIVVQVSDGDYTNVADYREYVKGLIKEQNEAYFVDNAKSQLFAEVVDKSELINYTETDLKGYIDYANEYYAEYAEYLGVDMETFRKDTMNFETEDEFTNFIHEEALSNLKTEYIIRAIAEKENITVTDEEVDAEIKNYIDNGYFATEEDVLNYTTRDEIITNKKYYKILDIIYENATITPYTGEPEKASSDIVVPTDDAAATNEATTDDTLTLKSE